MSNTLSTDEYRSVVKMLKNDICRQCRMCPEVKDPDFCAQFFVVLGYKFVQNLVALVKYVRQEKQNIYSKLFTLEGFSALFCDAHICNLYDEKRCIPETMADCYQLFKFQGGSKLDAEMALKMASKWDERLFLEVCHSLDIAAQEIMSLPKKQRKRLLKIGKHSVSMLDKFKNKKLACGYSNNKTKRVQTNKKVSTTKWFCRNLEFADVVKNILEGKYKQLNENNNRKQPNADGHIIADESVVHTELNVSQPCI